MSFEFTGGDLAGGFTWDPDTDMFTDVLIVDTASTNYTGLDGDESGATSNDADNSDFDLSMTFDPSLPSATSVSHTIMLGGTIFDSGTSTIDEVPLPAAAWLFISAIGGLGIIKRKRS